MKKLNSEIKYLLSFPEYSISRAAAILSGVHPEAVKYYPDGTAKVLEDWESHNDAAILANTFSLNTTDRLYLPKSVERKTADQRTKAFNTVATALEEAILAGNLAATVRESSQMSGLPQPHRWWTTFITKAALMYWLDQNELPRGIFENVPAPSARPLSNLPPSQDPNHPSYSHMLAAANAAHEHTASRNLTKKGKEEAKKWLESENAAGRWLDHNGKPWGDTALERIAMIVNCDHNGGAPSTP